MAVFDGNVKTKLLVPDPRSDHKLPHPGSLSLTSMTEVNALAGTRGHHCNLVHGDHWNEVNGNQTENISRNQTIKVVGKHKETLVESCYQNIVGPQIVLNNNVRNETRLNTFTLVYGSSTNQQSSDGESWIKPTDNEMVLIESIELDNQKFEVVLAHIEVVGVHGELVGVHGEYKAIHGEINHLHFAHDDINAEDDEFHSKVEALRIRVALNTTFDNIMEVHDACFENHTAVMMTYVGEETHTGPAVFAAITSPMIFP